MSQKFIKVKNNNEGSSSEFIVHSLELKVKSSKSVNALSADCQQFAS